MIFITGATGGIGYSLVQNILSTNMECCAIVRNIDKAHLLFRDNIIKNNKLFITNYQFNYFPETQRVTQDIILILNAFDITPIKIASKITKEEVNLNVNFNIIKQIEIVNKIFKFSLNKNVALKMIFLDSGAAYKPIKGWGLYCAGKAYLNMYLQVFSLENNIPLLLYDPGVVDTNMQEFIRRSNIEDFPMVDTFRNYHQLGQLHSPEDIAKDIINRYLKKWTARQLREKYEAQK